jgi:hypothetical protein
MKISALALMLAATSVFGQGQNFINELGPDSSVTVSNVALSRQQWIDLFCTYGFSVLGPNAPALTAVSAGSPIQLLAFDNNDILYAQTQFPHNIAVTNAWLPTFYFTPHVHFSVTRAPVGAASNVTWRIIWQLASINGSYGTQCATNSATAGVDAARKHYILSFPSITNDSIGISAMFRCRIDRPASASNDFSNDHDVLLEQIDLHVPVGTARIIGSRYEAAP